MSATILAVDLGDSRYRAGLASTDDPASVRPIGEWPAPPTREAFLTMLEGQLAEHGGARLGLGIPGLAQRAKCRWVPNLPYLDGLDLAARFPGVEVALGNDAHFALLAEVMGGAAVGLSDAILVAIGTGIGSAVLADSHIVAGARGGACSFGWAAADLADPGDGWSGWLERLSSGRALDAAAAAIGLRDGAELIDRVRAGDGRAKAALYPPMRALGTALAGAVGLLDPEAIIFAGGVAEALDDLAPLILWALVRQLPPPLRGIELKAAHFGRGAGLVGAALAGALGADWRERRHA